MAIPASGEYRLSRRVIKPLRASRIPREWDGTTSSPNSFHTFHCPPSVLSHGFAPTPKSPASPRLVSPVTVKEESVHLRPDILPPLGAGWVESRKRKRVDDGGGRSSKLPSIRDALPDVFSPNHFKPNQEVMRKPKQKSAPSSLRTPSMTPEPSEGNPFPRRPSYFIPFDSITHELNKRRSIENKIPLPATPLAPLNEVGYPNGVTHMWTPDSRFPEGPCQQPPPPEEMVDEKKKSQHCNVKYTMEQLDFIRYHRADLNMKWGGVETRFADQFPKREVRKAQGLQGVCYRQNKFLPHIYDDKLIFMENGHVATTCMKTRDQGDKKDKYFFLYLWPDRALKYTWITTEHRQLAMAYEADRRRQKDLARIDAERRGMYMEKLPPEVPCGCCPGEDRETKKKQAAKKKASKKGERSNLDSRQQLAITQLTRPLGSQ